MKTILIGIITGFANGLFGAGGGTIVVPAMERILGVEEHKAHATAIAVILPLSMISAGIYMQKQAVDWSTVFYVSIGGVVGGYIGAKILNKIPSKWLHKVFGLFMLVAAIRMII